MRVFSQSAVFVLAVTLLRAQPAGSQTLIHFADRNLEQAVRVELHKPEGELTSTDMLQLTRLYAPNYRITDLSGLETASNLSVLQVAQNDITNAAALADMPQLVWLDLSFNYVHDLSPMLCLSNLTTLFLAGNGLEMFPPLDSMPGLAQLSLAYNRISDPSPLRSITSLRYLDLTANPISDVAVLCQMTNLATLQVRQLALTSASSLSCLTHLVSLGLDGNQLTEVSALTNLIDLQGLDLSGNPITNCAPLADLRNLQALTIGGNTTCDWGPLALLTHLSSLTINAGAVTNIGWLIALHDLSRLSLPQNSITDISPLTALTNLFELDLSDNPLANYAPLAELKNLQFLYVNGNGLTDISYVASLPQLTGLSVVWNRIADLSPLGALTNLSWFEASFNLLTNIAEFRNLPHLQFASLNGNLLDLRQGSEAMGVIQDLLSNGVSVYYEPQLGRPQILMKPQWLLPAGEKSWLSFGLFDGAGVEFQMPPTVNVYSANSALIPEDSFVLRHSVDYFQWELAVIAAPSLPGTTTLTVVATNYAGLWTNLTVEIQVVPPAGFDSGFLDCPDLFWRTAGAPPWFGENGVSHDGVGAAQSGAPDSWVQTTVKGPGVLRFWFRLASDYFYANGQFTAVSQESDLRGYEHLHRRGEVWQEEIVSLPAGKWILKWSPWWDNWSYPGVNTLWLDQVSFIPGAPVCWLEPTSYEVPSGGREFNLHGLLGQKYQVEVSSNLRTWLPLTQVTCENFEASFRDEKVAAAARFYRARALP